MDGWEIEETEEMSEEELRKLLEQTIEKYKKIKTKRAAFWWVLKAIAIASMVGGIVVCNSGASEIAGFASVMAATIFSVVVVSADIWEDEEIDYVAKKEISEIKAKIKNKQKK